MNFFISTKYFHM